MSTWLTCRKCTFSFKNQMLCIDVWCFCKRYSGIARILSRGINQLRHRLKIVFSSPESINSLLMLDVNVTLMGQHQTSPWVDWVSLFIWHLNLYYNLSASSWPSFIRQDSVYTSAFCIILSCFISYYWPKSATNISLQSQILEMMISWVFPI